MRAACSAALEAAPVMCARSPPGAWAASVAIVASPLDRELILDLFEERAAIREFCGGQTRAEAEAGAVGDVAKSTGIYPPTLRQLRIGRGND